MITNKILTLPSSRKYLFEPPEYLRRRDDFAPARNLALNCPDHIVASGSNWYCTNCGEIGYCQYEHGLQRYGSIH